MKQVGKLTVNLIIVLSLAACAGLPTTSVLTQTPLVNYTLPPSNTTSTSIATSPIASPTLTLGPTLPPVEAEAKALELLHNNGGCRFPCFLGLTPGQTRKHRVASFSHMFNSISPSTEITFPRDDLFLGFSVNTQDGFNAQPEIIKWIEVDTKAYRKLETKLEKDYESPYYSEIFHYYTLPSLLTTYGIPENVYVFLDTGIADMGLGIDLYLVHLDYPKQGWVAHLEMPLHTRGDLLLGCPSKAFTKLRLWSPDDPARDFTLDSSVLFTIEEATGMSVDEFYQKFKDPANTLCLETPANIRK